MTQEPVAVPYVVFYSWQSDLPNATNRGFVEKALQNAAKSVRADGGLAGGLIIDRDTKGVPGSPEIASTIFGKIDQAQVIVCDVSIINHNCVLHDKPARPTPNPNVLIEVGYALKSLGDKRVVLVMNEAYGNTSLLPFDLKSRRAITYNMPENCQDRQPERKRLEAILTDALRAIGSELTTPVIDELPPAPLAEQVRIAIEEASPKRVSLAQRYMKQFASDIAALQPPFQDAQRSRSDDGLVAAINSTTNPVLAYSRVAEAVAASNDAETTHAMYSGFTRLLDLYWTPREFTSGMFYEEAFDLARFIGHEALVTLYAMLLRENRWDLIGDLLDEDLYANTMPHGKRGPVELGYVSQYVRLLDVRKSRLGLRYATVHGHLLNERHASGELAGIMPMSQFVEADYFLYLICQLRPHEAPKHVMWRPWSAVYLEYIPRYLEMAVRMKGAGRLVRVFQVDDIPALRLRFAERVLPLGDVFGWPWFDDPTARFDPQSFGTKA